MKWFMISSLLPAIIIFIILQLSLTVECRLPEAMVANSRMEAKSKDNNKNISALYVLGDSSVDCGNNTLFYPLVHSRFSLYSCDRSDSSLLPQLLGTFLFLHLLIYCFMRNLDQRSLRFSNVMRF